MPNGLLIGKTVYKLLSENQDIKNKVGNKIFPLIANLETTFPFIVYSRNSVVPEYTKGGIVEDIINLEIICVSTSYIESIEIANLVRRTLEMVRYKDDDMIINQCRLLDVAENYQDDAYTQTLIFEIRIS